MLSACPSSWTAGPRCLLVSLLVAILLCCNSACGNLPSPRQVTIYQSVRSITTIEDQVTSKLYQRGLHPRQTNAPGENAPPKPNVSYIGNGLTTFTRTHTVTNSRTTSTYTIQVVEAITSTVTEVVPSLPLTSSTVLPPSSSSTGSNTVSGTVTSPTSRGGDTDENTSSGEKKSKNIGLIAGVAVLAVVLGIIAAVLIFMFLRRKRRKQQELEGAAGGSSGDNQQAIDAAGVGHVFKAEMDATTTHIPAAELHSTALPELPGGQEAFYDPGVGGKEEVKSPGYHDPGTYNGPVPVTYEMN